MPKQQQKQAVIYARFSPRRNADECESCETQIDYCTNYCVFQKLEILDIYRDDGLSGAEADNRPGVQEAIEQAIKHKASLVVYSVDRLARSVKDAIDLTDRLKKGKAAFCSVTENIDTTTALGNMYFQLAAIFAEMFRRQISETTSAAMRRHQANGRKMSSRTPYGWRFDPDNPQRMLPDEAERRAIDKIKELRELNFSYRRIANWLTEHDYKARPVMKVFKSSMVQVKGKWHFGTIRNILSRVELDVF